MSAEKNWSRGSALAVWPFAMLIACGSGTSERTGHAPSEASGCFDMLSEPAVLDCNSREPVSVHLSQRRTAAAACLFDANHASRERAQRSALERQHLTLAALPTVVYSDPMERKDTGSQDSMVPW